MLLMIDHDCSFTDLQAYYFRALGQDVLLKKHNAVTLGDIERLNPTYIVLSSGPCTPNETVISLPLIQHFAGKIPILGICLGHQIIAQAFGGHIIPAPTLMHGKTSCIHHANTHLFQGLPQPFTAVRYHSLVIDPARLPSELITTAWSQGEDGQLETIMAIAHRQYPLMGVQFHPESLCCDHGYAILRQFLAPIS